MKKAAKGAAKKTTTKKAANKDGEVGDVERQQRS